MLRTMIPSSARRARSAGIKSMLRSLHNFLFVSFDPSGLIMIDKPPLGSVSYTHLTLPTILLV